MKTLSFFSAPFRPFFLGATFLASFVPILWVLNLNNYIELNTNFSDPLSWHIHEMIFGFSWALLTGFLLTASSHWSGKRPLIGSPLAILSLLWLLPRLCIHSSLPFMLTTFLNIIFAFSFNYIFWLMIRENRNKKIIFPLTLLFAFSQVLFLYAELTSHLFLYDYSIKIAIASLCHIIIIMAGRLVPMFTRNALGLKIFPPNQLNNILCSLPLITLYLPDNLLPKYLAILILVIGVFFNFLRCTQWQSWKTVKMPIVAILHLGQIAICLFFISKILVLLDIIDPSISSHFFTVGVLGIFSIAMFQRVSKGHTGRKIDSSILDNIIFISIIFAFITRAILPSFNSDYLDHSYLISGVLWFIGFFLYFIKYFIPLTTPRY